MFSGDVVPMFQLSEDVQRIIFTALISGIVSPAIVLMLSKLLSKRMDDVEVDQKKLQMTETSQKIAAQAIADLAVAKRQITDMDSRILLLEKATRGPYRLTLDFSIGSDPIVHGHKLELIELDQPGQGV